MASVTICDRLGRDGQVVCYIVRAHVRFLFYIKTCANSENVKKYGWFLDLGLGRF